MAVYRKVDSLWDAATSGGGRRVHRKVYRFRMEPTQAQAEALLRMAGARRFVWNWGLSLFPTSRPRRGGGTRYASFGLKKKTN